MLTSQVQSLNPREQGAEEECVTVTASAMGPRVREQDVLELVHDVLQRSVVDYDCVLGIEDSPITTEQGVQVFQEELLLRSGTMYIESRPEESRHRMVVQDSWPRTRDGSFPLGKR